VEPSEFKGRIGRYHWESEPWWFPDPTPPTGAPNVLLVVLDDVGYAQLGCFGSDIDTPTIDRLAATASATPTSTRPPSARPPGPAVLTGRNHHRVGMGRIVDLATGFPGYDARIPASCAMAAGHAHPPRVRGVRRRQVAPDPRGRGAPGRPPRPLAPRRGSSAGTGSSRARRTSSCPRCIHDTTHVEPPARRTRTATTSRPTSWTDRSSTWRTSATSTSTSRGSSTSPPAHATRPTSRRPTGASATAGASTGAGTSGGVDGARHAEGRGPAPAHTQLSPRPDWVPAWSDLDDTERRVYARYMEAFAAFLSHTDHELGRLIDRLEPWASSTTRSSSCCRTTERRPRAGRSDRSTTPGCGTRCRRTVEEAAERIDEIGGPTLHNNYPWGWTVAGNTPFRRWKRETHEGGVADPLIVHWPNGIAARGEVRHQYVHAIDVLPTLLELIGVDLPSTVAGVAQEPLDGVSFAPTFDDDRGAPRSTTVQYFEMLGCRALYRRGLEGRHLPPHPGRRARPRRRAVGAVRPARRPVRVHDLGGGRPDLLQAMVEAWWSEAERNRVLPSRQSTVLRPGVSAASRPWRPAPATRTGPTARPCPSRWRSTCAPGASDHRARHGGRDGPPVEGVLIVQGSVLGGWSFHLLRAAISCTCTTSPAGGTIGWRPRSDPRPGDHTLTFAFVPPAAEPRGSTGGRAGRGAPHRVEPLLAHRRGPDRRLVTRPVAGGARTTAATSRSPPRCTTSTSTSRACPGSTATWRSRTSSRCSSDGLVRKPEIPARTLDRVRIGR
jgi:arylsulfatase A-like enzyme